eukprot:533924_1
MNGAHAKYNSLNLLQIDERKKVIKYLFYYCGNKDSSFKLKYSFYCGENKHLRFVIHYAMIKNTSLIYQTLLKIGSQFKKCENIGNTKLINNFIELFRILTSDRLTLKYIFNKTPKIWKILLSTIMTLLLTHWHVLEDSQLMNLMILLARSSSYWENTHWSLIINHGFCKLLMRYTQKIYKDFIMLMLKTNSSTVFTEKQMAIFIPYMITKDLQNSPHKIKMRKKYKKQLYVEYKTLSKLDQSATEMQELMAKGADRELAMSMQLSCNALNVVEKSYKLLSDANLLNRNYQIIKNKKIKASSHNIVSGDLTSVSDKIKTPKSFCKWIFCGNTQRKLYKCKGCQLINYCCRKHQKQHWTYIHSQQCLRNIN